MKDQFTMKTKIIFLLSLSLWFVTAKANLVGEKQARQIGAKFLNGTKKMPATNAEALDLVKTYYCSTGEAAIYVFNAEMGFVIVSADDCMTPVLGYSHESLFDPFDIPMQLQDYLDGFVSQIEHGVTNRLIADDAVAAQWESVMASGRIKDRGMEREVRPLLNEKWHQNCYYNKLCPEDINGPCGHAYAGCVATAMAQIMHYWKYPKSGQGAYSYIPSSHPEYGEQSVDFSATTYDWANMPNSLNGSSSDLEVDAVATLMWHCGVAVDMLYGPSGSGAFSEDVGSALLTFFGYSDELCLMSREEDSVWIARLKGSLDLLRPVYYSGYDSVPGGNVAYGHAFVCDGYDRDGLFHFNWGWGGRYNGYFALDNIGYTHNNQALFDIHVPLDTDSICRIQVALDPPNSGVIDGVGACHYGELHTLTAHAYEGYKFQAWMENDAVLSTDSVYTIPVLGDRDIVAFFEAPWSAQVKVACLQDSVLSIESARISWTNDSIGGDTTGAPWPLMLSFEYYTNVSSSVFTDGMNIYTTAEYIADKGLMLHQWDLSGRLLESFIIDGCGLLEDIAYDGKFFYGSSNDSVLYCVDIVNKTLVDVIPTTVRSSCCTYDPDNDGFWVNDLATLKLVDRNGVVVKTGPTLNSLFTTAYYRNAIGNPHLLIYAFAEGKVLDYDIHDDLLDDEALYSFDNGSKGGIFLGEFMDRAAFFIARDFGRVEVRRAPMDIAQARYYRVYRTKLTIGDEKSYTNMEVIADRNYGAEYVDHAWDTLPCGFYSYGVSLLRRDDVESEISWSEPVERVNHGVDEHDMNMVLLYPNPVRDRLLVQCLKPFSRCEVFSITGAMVYSKDLADCESMEINVGDLPSGMYLLRLITEDSILAKRFVINSY